VVAGEFNPLYAGMGSVMKGNKRAWPRQLKKQKQLQKCLVVGRREGVLYGTVHSSRQVGRWGTL